MEKVINKLFKALRMERSSQESGASRFGTHNIMSFLGGYHGVLSVFVLSCIAWFTIIILVSCGSSKQMSSEQVNENDTEQTQIDTSEQTNSTTSSDKAKSATDSVSTTTEQKNESSENSETVTITEITIYDTSDTAKDSKPKVSKTIRQTKIEKRGASTSSAQKGTTNKTSTVVANEKEENKTKSESSSSATTNKRKETKRSTDKKQSVSESKQTLYIALTFFGIALAILACVIARWVFSKYRPKSQG